MAVEPAAEFVGGEVDMVAIPEAPAEILGQKPKVMIHHKHLTVGWSVRCQNPLHLNCNKCRSVRLDLSRGPKGTEVVVFTGGG